MMYNCGQNGWCQLNIGNTVNQDINHFGRHCIHQCSATSWDARTSLSDIEIFSFFLSKWMGCQFPVISLVRVHPHGF